LVKNRFFWRWQYIVYRRPPKPRNMLLISANSEKKNKLRDMMTPDLIFQITKTPQAEIRMQTHGDFKGDAEARRHGPVLGAPRPPLHFLVTV